ncbi:putative flavoprotein [Synechococcus sp. PCC 7502]|uniref:diflavin flavoprotein n=1 Tax=Synechococcus sp. PCC 7502 TaxID=1173263 RepID=UPI00029FE561|nr:diflavin flavoprotein [Synechococcus sp. PCC 7502]AFY73659.1 putative flavoprotein [Synechococcus sp. PCC 7502]
MRTPPRDVQILPIAAETLALRCRSWNRLRFEVEYALERGTTANSFLIQGEKTALIDPPGATFTEIFLEQLQNRLPIEQIDYVILGHINPNRIETVKALVALNPNITFICSNPGAIAIRNILEKSDAVSALKLTTVRGDEILELGKGHTLQFVTTSTPRYPDGLCTFDQKTQVLYTGKLFGAHICGDQLFDEGWSALLEDRRYYFDCVLANQTRQLESIMDKLAEFTVSFYAPGHGTMLKYGLSQLLISYRQWAEAQKQKNISVALIYASAYGNTTILGQAIARGITKANVAVELINCESATPEEIKAAIEKSSGFMIGSPTLAGHLPTQVQTALGLVLANAPKGSLAGVFGSFGWSGEAVDIIADKLKDAGFSLGFEPIRVKFAPTETTLQMCEETGTDFAQALKAAKKIRNTLNPGSSIEQAVGRVVGSLCVATVQKGDVRTAMLASWVAQATFNPPGFTIAVAKERAIESYLHLGDRFVLNILEQGKQLRKYFLKRFAPGEDRFIDVATETAQNGSPILTDALAYLECKVEQRMEAGDHWIIYAVVDQGKVLQANGITAVHHRKSGGHY